MAFAPTSWPAPVAPLTLDAPSGQTTLDLRVPDESAPALQLSNDTWDTDPTDPNFKFFADNDGSTFFGPPGTGRNHTLSVRGARLRLQCGSFQVLDATASPADASLSAGEFALWLDATIGATKLMVKAKDSGGTVRTAAIALA